MIEGEMKLTAINKYPVKSLKGLSVNHSQVDGFGIKNDRRWMLVDSEGGFVTQRKYPLMGLISVEDDGDALKFTSANGQVLKVLISHLSNPIGTVVWGDAVTALKADSEASEWFSELLGVRVDLVYMPDSSFRQVDRQFADYKQRVSFADGFPFLLISESSLIDLNNRLENPVMMSRFRPNLEATSLRLRRSLVQRNLSTMSARIVHPAY